MKGQVKFDASPDLGKVVGGKFEYKGDMPKGSQTKKVGKHSSIRCGDQVELGVSTVDPLAGLKSY